MTGFLSAITRRARSVTLVGTVLTLQATQATANPFDLRFGQDVLIENQSGVTAFNHLSLMYPLGGGVRVGQTILSASGGDGGGLFIGGFELSKRFHLGTEMSLDIGAFVGGGGGASIVLGDGLTTRAHLTFNKRFHKGLNGYLGLSWYRIEGSAVDTPALTFGLTQSIDFALSGEHESGHDVEGVSIASLKPFAATYAPISSTQRGSNIEVEQMYLLGAELAFTSANGQGESFLRAAGAIAGDGAGYAEWLLGHRWYFTPNESLRFHSAVSAGFAGGGGVDTGGGLLLSLGGGLTFALTDGFGADVNLSAVYAPDGDFTAVSASISGVWQFDRMWGGQRHPASEQHWQFSSGVSLQVEHPEYRNPDNALTGSPLLAEVSADLFLTEKLYVTGNAKTVLSGNAAGFAGGELGFGYRQQIAARWALSGELFIGAAAGGGINTGGGIIGGARAELDYAVQPDLYLSLGAGKFQSSGKASPWTLHAGIKVPFTSYHR